MSYCQKCGNPLKEEQQYCENCGEKIVINNFQSGVKQTFVNQQLINPNPTNVIYVQNTQPAFIQTNEYYRVNEDSTVYKVFAIIGFIFGINLFFTMIIFSTVFFMVPIFTFILSIPSMVFSSIGITSKSCKGFGVNGFVFSLLTLILSIILIIVIVSLD